MIYRISIPMMVLPTAYYVVGVLLLLVALVAIGLFLLKLREVALLKKEVEELRDTMRMMRYEEANLSRMLHTVDKAPSISVVQELCEDLPEDVVDDVIETEDEETEDEIIQSEELEEDMPEESACEEIVDEQPVIIAEPSSEPLIEHDAVNELSCNDSVEEVVDEDSMSESVDESEDLMLVEEQPMRHKQAINERRPAIPHDLFSAWFAENEEEEQVDEPSLVNPEQQVVVSPCEEAIAVDVEAHATSVDSLVHSNNVEVSTEKKDESVAVEGVEEEAVSGELEKEASEIIETTELSKDGERFCRKLERIVHTRMKNPNLNIDIIASQFGMGRTNFYRKVRELMGMSPNDYLRKCRMERAAEIIKTTNLPIADICAQVGIPDAQYFSRVFKSFFGTTPSAYREQNSKE